MRIHRRALAAGVAVVALGAAGLALASIPSSTGVINAASFKRRPARRRLPANLWT